MEEWSVPACEWFVLDLAGIPLEMPYRPDTTTWSHLVDWWVVNRIAVAVVEEMRGRIDFKFVDEAADLLTNETDRQGFQSLFLEPIDASTVQITNGIHRIGAMRAQGIHRTIALRLIES